MKLKRRFDLLSGAITITGFSLCLFAFQNCSNGLGGGANFQLASVTDPSTNSPLTIPPPPVVVTDSKAGDWDESANRLQFSSTLYLDWQNNLGDWVDADGVSQGTKPFQVAALIDDNLPGPIEIDVTQMLLSTKKADFFIKRSGGGNFVFKSRESGEGPVLILDSGEPILSVADTYLDGSTTSPLGNGMTLSTSGNILIRFNLPANAKFNKAILKLVSTGAEYGNQNLEIYAVNSSLRIIQRPKWLSANSTVVAAYDGSIFNGATNAEVKNKVATLRLMSPNLTWGSATLKLPFDSDGKPHVQLCATVYQKIHSDFQPGDGGKLPGFSNTGQATSGTDIIDGVSYPDTAWGGRSPDHVHWSARTGYGGWNSQQVAARTYFYAMSPHNSYGHVEALGWPFEKGKWQAYIQCVQMNSVIGAGKSGSGQPDGKLYYELIGAGPLYSRENIVWRDFDYPESLIREFWIDYYCGGTSCGANANRGTISFAKAVITKGLPDVEAIKTEVERLNQDFP